MASHRPSIRFATPSLVLALVLVSGSTAPAIARDATGGGGLVMGGAAARPVPEASRAGTRQAVDHAAWRQLELSPSVDRAAQPVAAVRPPTEAIPTATAVAVARSAPTATGSASAPSAYHGRNHVWIPSLGVNRSVAFFSCSSKAYPGNRVYRWGCAGSNNIYLFGHASSVFKPLHDAYVSGRLRKGMTIFYAGGDGRVHRYAIRWWKATTPDKGAWAFASQSKPSLTLQTCVGARSQFRLIVRLVRTG
jgi:sortase (surface protein transpeptidase)